jgi:uncharacterized protein
LKTINSNEIDAHEAEYLYIGSSQLSGAGNGLFTAIDLFKEETIAVFKGEVLTDAEAKQRAESGKDNYFINLLDGSIMDSMHVLCFAKYANDAEGLSNGDFKNNARITLDDDDNVCIQALGDIKANEEVFCSYGKRYWRNHG